MYPTEMTKPIQEELINQGFTNLETVNDVQNYLSKKGTSLILINSVCGCAAGSARPGTIASLKGEKKPDHIATVFAGVDKQATEEVRKYTKPFPPSSPSVALFKDGEIVHMIERHHIEGKTAKMLAENLMTAYVEFC